MNPQDVQPTDANVEVNPQMLNDEDDESFNLHDYLPDELRQAFDEASDELGTQQEVRYDQQEIQPEPSPRDEETIAAQSEEVDFSPEAIDKLIDGDINALNQTQETTEEPTAPYWAEEEDYKELYSALEHTTGTPDKLNALIQKIADKSVVDNSQLVNGLRKEVDTYKRQIETQADELTRAREISRGVTFDNDPEVQSKYHQPAQANFEKIEHILRQEGANLNASQVVGITNKATLLRTLQENGVDDAKASEVLSEWRARQDTVSEYTSAKNAAMRNSAQLAAARVTPERIQNIMKNSLLDLIAQEDYADVKEAIKDGIDKHEDISTVIQKGRNNLTFFAQHLNPEQLHDEKFMSELARYALTNANAERKQHQLPKIQAERDTWKDKATKLAKAYKDLASSGRGIVGKPSTPTLARAKAREEEKSAESLAKELEDRLASGDDMPFGKQFFADEE